MKSVIIALCIIVTAVTAATIIVGGGSFEGLVVDKPYEAGLAWDDARRNRNDLGWSVALRRIPFRTGQNDLSFQVFGKDGSPLLNAEVALTVSRPSTRSFDRTYQMIPQENNQYRATVDLPLPGKWDVLMRITQGKSSCSISESLYAEKAGS